jgi:hypothetical protein
MVILCSSRVFAGLARFYFFGLTGNYVCVAADAHFGNTKIVSIFVLK